MNNYPLIKFVLFFICGFIIQALFNIQLSFLLFISFILFIIIIYLNFHKLFIIRDILLVCLITIVGACYYSTFHKNKVAYPFYYPKITNVLLTGNITKIELLKENKIVFYLTTDTLYINNQIVKKKINLLCSFFDEKKNLRIIYNLLGIGNKVKLRGNILRPRDIRNPGEFDYENYLNEKQIHALFNIYNLSDLKIISKEGNIFLNVVHNFRKKIDNIITSNHNKNTAALLRGLLLADRSTIDLKIKNDFINSGVIHVLAVSGLHVGYIMLIFVLLFQRFSIYLKYIFTIIGLISFMIITNSPPSVVRATIMALCFILSYLIGRKYNNFNALSLAALIILIINPNELFNPGFQLSFTAVLSILIFYPKLKSNIDSLNIKLNTVIYVLFFISISIASQIGMIPLIIYYFGKLSLISLIANIVVIPLVGIIISLGIFTIFISIISVYLCNFYSNANELFTFILFIITNKLGNLSFAFIPINQFSLVDSFWYYTLLLFNLYILKKFNSLGAKLLLIIVSILNFYFLIKIDDVDLLPENILSVMAIDIGQGDSYLIKFPNKKVALIDAGNANKYFDNGEKIIMPLMERLGIDKIDYGFISHVDSDHYRGFLSLIKNKKVKLIYKPKLDTTDKNDLELENFLIKNKIPIEYYSKKILKEDGVRIYILNDIRYNSSKVYSSNDNSGVIKIVYGKTSILFTGDIGMRVEKHYVDVYSKFLKSNVLKISHHGSKFSTSELFLDYTNSNYAIISVGIINRFNHPHKEVLNRLYKKKVKILRTDINGCIILHSDGNYIRDINWKKLNNKFIF